MPSERKTQPTRMRIRKTALAAWFAQLTSELNAIESIVPPFLWALKESSFRLRLGLRANTRTGWLRLSRFRTESPSRVALRPIVAGYFPLPSQLLDALLPVLPPLHAPE